MGIIISKDSDDFKSRLYDAKDKDGTKGYSQSDSVGFTNTELIDEQKRRIIQFNLELGGRAYRYQMLVSGKYRNTCDQEKEIVEWEAYCKRLLETAGHDSHIPKLGLTLEQYVNLSTKYCKSLYIYTYLIRPWLDKTPEPRYKDKKWGVDES